MTDTFRKVYKENLPQVKDDIFVFKSKAEALLYEFDAVNLREETDKRCMSLAKTNLEQAIMWAVKAIT
jgi:hypothetical protein